MSSNHHLTEVYKTKDGIVYQDDLQKCLIIDFAGQKTCYSVDGFFQLKKLVDRVDIHSMVADASNHADLEIIYPLASDRCYVLNFCEIIKLRSLLNGAKVMLELNSIIRESLYTPVVV
ncbi:hypothetical protein [Xanthovirga aplysinae]|uniref:hypothetical protein n=1 Tax=Xanthovirga aplysinae TaxID=2529853 RepID=UPI0012BB63B0|nr:hypothetical protein [Xanthovirga aplysinae]MTI33037.1 hypothetical protein [Xanthovirga aplysinae]